MSAIPIWPDNDRVFRLSGVKTLDTGTGKMVADDTLTITVFISTSEAPDASALTGTTVTASSLGRGKYKATYDAASNLPLSVMRAAAGGATATLWLHWVCAGSFHVVQELAYAEQRTAA